MFSFLRPELLHHLDTGYGHRAWSALESCGVKRCLLIQHFRPVGLQHVSSSRVTGLARQKRISALELAGRSWCRPGRWGLGTHLLCTSLVTLFAQGSSAECLFMETWRQAPTTQLAFQILGGPCSPFFHWMRLSQKENKYGTSSPRPKWCFRWIQHIMQVGYALGGAELNHSEESYSSVTAADDTLGPDLQACFGWPLLPWSCYKGPHLKTNFDQ